MQFVEAKHERWKCSAMQMSVHSKGNKIQIQIQKLTNTDIGLSQHANGYTAKDMKIQIQKITNTDTKLSPHTVC